MELLYYKKTNQTYRQATGTYPAWFWLSKLYAFYSGQSTNAILQPANAAFWAEKLANLSTFEAPAIVLTINSTPLQTIADNGIFTPSNPVQGATVTYTVTVRNSGTGELRIQNATRLGDVSSITTWSALSLAPGQSATCTITLTTASAGAKSGSFSFGTNIPGGQATYSVNVAYTVRSLDNVIDQDFAPILDLKMVATSGTTEVNRGTGGSALNATLVNLTLSQSIGSQPAFDFSQDTSRIEVPNDALISTLTTWRVLYMLRPDSILTAGGFSREIANYGSPSNDNARNYSLAATNRLALRLVNTLGTTFTFRPASNSLDAIMTPHVGGLLFIDYDDANSLGNGRVARMYLGVNQTLTLLSLLTSQPLTGTYRAPTAIWVFGNIGTAAHPTFGWTPFDGLYGRVSLGSGLWTTQLMTDILTASGL